MAKYPLKCPECDSERVSVRCDLWVDFSERGQREVDEEDLEKSEPRFGAPALCRKCGYNWTYDAC